MDSRALNDYSYKKFILKILIDITIIIVIFVSYILVYYYFKPNIVYLTCSDTDIIYPFKDETIYFWSVALYGLLGPIIFIILVELKYSLNSKELDTLKIAKFFLFNLFQAISLFILGVSIVLLLTELSKRWIGRLRPHFLDICKPNFAAINCNKLTQIGFFQQSIYSGNSFCSISSNSTLLINARMSFPSVHASFSTYTMLFLVIYLELRLYLKTFGYFKHLVQLVAILLVLFTCLTRVRDYYCRSTDVIFGCLLGASIALFICFQKGHVLLWKYLNQDKQFFSKPKNDSDMDIIYSLNESFRV